MDMTNEELDFTKIHRNMVKYTKLAGKGKGLTGEQFLEFYNAYCELYDLLCEYMNAYNRECADYEQTIDELYKARDYYRKLYFEEKEKKYNITIPLENTGLEDIEYYYKKGDKWYAHYKEIQVDKTKAKELEEQSKSDITEKELKDMIIGMLE